MPGIRQELPEKFREFEILESITVHDMPWAIHPGMKRDANP